MVLREVCASWLWHFLGIFTSYILLRQWTFLLKCEVLSGFIVDTQLINSHNCSAVRNVGNRCLRRPSIQILENCWKIFRKKKIKTISNHCKRIGHLCHTLTYLWIDEFILLPGCRLSWKMALYSWSGSKHVPKHSQHRFLLVFGTVFDYCWA